MFFLVKYFNLGTVFGRQAVEYNYKWPSHHCRGEKEPDYFVNVGEYAETIWEIIRKDGGDECQTEVEF